MEAGHKGAAERRYADALPDLQTVSESERADADDFDQLGRCLGKLGRWPESVTAHTRSLDADPKSPGATGRVPNLLEALVIAGRPGEAPEALARAEEKGWKPPTEGGNAALYRGLRAVALRAAGEDAAEAEAAMRKVTGKKGYAPPGRPWDELDAWFKSGKLAVGRTDAVRKVVDGLKGPEADR